jgi:hypothetical protein
MEDDIQIETAPATNKGKQRKSKKEPSTPLVTVVEKPVVVVNKGGEYDVMVRLDGGYMLLPLSLKNSTVSQKLVVNQVLRQLSTPQLQEVREVRIYHLSGTAPTWMVKRPHVIVFQTANTAPN